jgi:XapX domain-containing protein
MSIYLISLAAGILMGLVYSFIRVRSPAPPAIALVGLLGMLLGSQLVPISKQVLQDKFSVAWFAAVCVPNITGIPASPLNKKKGE